MINSTRIGQRIRAAREARGLTQADVGDHLGLSADAISKIELGQSNLTLPNLEKLPAILERPISYFLGLDNSTFSDEEIELVHLYRALPPVARSYTLAGLRAWLHLPHPGETAPPAELMQRLESALEHFTPEERRLILAALRPRP